MTTQSTGSNNALLAAGVVGLVVSLVIVLFKLVGEGHAAFNTTSDGMMWGLPVAVYVFFVLTSTGLTFVASMAMVFGLKDFYPIAKRCVWLAVATLVAGFTALAFELGHPFRMLWAIPVSFQYKAPLNWMGVFYSLYLVFLLLKFRKMHADDWDSRTSRNLGIASLLAVIVAHSTLGLVFGMMAMRPFWYGGLIPVYFLVTALLSGLAFAVLFTHLAHRSMGAAVPAPVRELLAGSLPKVFAFALGVVLLFSVSRTITGLWSNAEGLQAFHWMIGAPWFWIEMAALLVAFVILLTPGMRSGVGAQVLASLLVIVALFIGRYEYMIGGQVVPLFKGSWVPEFIPYTPSLTEWMLALLAVGVTLTIYALGDRVLNLSAQPRAFPARPRASGPEGAGKTELPVT
jgi:molybdopterin-containing oxidoreductase family membrane subunit